MQTNDPEGYNRVFQVSKLMNHYQVMLRGYDLFLVLEPILWTKSIFQNATFKKFNFRMRAKPDNYNDEVRVRHSVIGAEKVNFDNYNKMMAKELKENGQELPYGLDEY